MEFLNFFSDLKKKKKINFTLKTMFISIFLNIKLLLKKEKLKIILFFTELYILNEHAQTIKRKIKFQHQIYMLCLNGS